MSELSISKERWVNIQIEQKECVQSGHETDLASRIKKLNRLKCLLLDHEDEWFEALREDLGKSEIESYASEIAIVINEINFLIKNLADWMKSATHISRTAMGKVEQMLLRKPYGSVLIISPWNYPLQLTLIPLAGAVAAGNRCFIKPSEKSQAVSRLLNRLISHYFNPDEMFVVEGEAEIAQSLLEMSWDYIFFTGSSAVGQKVYEAASKQLTPVTLELGGKNPCIVDETNCTAESVRKIIWGKYLNAGQTCIAPDTIYVHETVQEEFKHLAIDTIKKFYGDEPENSDAYGRLIDKKQFDKMHAFISEGEILYGGKNDEKILYFGPTLVENINKHSAIASQEIFGPILPIVPYNSLNQLLTEFQKLEAPLITYFFTKDKSRINTVEKLMKTGSVMVNQVIINVADPEMPFGGVGKSGLGNYHGHASYKTFTYEKVLYHQSADYGNKMIFPPYSKGALLAIRTMRRWLS